MDKKMVFNGDRLRFLQEMSEVPPFKSVSRNALEENVFNGNCMESTLKNLIKKVNSKIKEGFGIETAFSLKGGFVYRNF